MNRTDFHKLAEIRIKDAKTLLDRRCYGGAFYLAGYAVECALKACIARKTQAYDFPPQDAKTFYTHDLDMLFSKADLKSLREARGAESDKIQIELGRCQGLEVCDTIRPSD